MTVTRSGADLEAPEKDVIVTAVPQSDTTTMFDLVDTAYVWLDLDNQWVTRCNILSNSFLKNSRKNCAWLVQTKSLHGVTRNDVRVVFLLSVLPYYYISGVPIVVHIIITLSTWIFGFSLRKYWVTFLWKIQDDSIVPPKWSLFKRLLLTLLMWKNKYMNWNILYNII